MAASESPATPPGSGNALRRGRIDRDVVVALPGGELRIGWRDDNAPITMTGPATFVFEGELSP